MGGYISQVERVNIKETPDVYIQEAVEFFESTMNLDEVMNGMKEVMAQKHRNKIFIGCGKARHNYKKCKNVRFFFLLKADLGNQ